MRNAAVVLLVRDRQLARACTPVRASACDSERAKTTPTRVSLRTTTESEEEEQEEEDHDHNDDEHDDDDDDEHDEHDERDDDDDDDDDDEHDDDKHDEQDDDKHDDLTTTPPARARLHRRTTVCFVDAAVVQSVDARKLARE